MTRWVSDMIGFIMGITALILVIMWALHLVTSFWVYLWK